jgi:ammonia channel protein AmtB
VSAEANRDKIERLEMREQFLTSLFWIPPLLVLFSFEFFLGHRHDYSGHYLAGYGATFIAAMLGLRNGKWDHVIRNSLPYLLVPFCLLCILGGGFTEATIFRLAKFDEVDFFNQSLGAVLALLVLQIFVDSIPGSQNDDEPNESSKLQEMTHLSEPIEQATRYKTTSASPLVRWCDGGLVIGVIYLGIGGFLAFA